MHTLRYTVERAVERAAKPRSDVAAMDNVVYCYCGQGVPRMARLALRAGAGRRKYTRRRTTVAAATITASALATSAVAPPPAPSPEPNATADEARAAPVAETAAASPAADAAPSAADQTKEEKAAARREKLRALRLKMVSRVEQLFHVDTCAFHKFCAERSKKSQPF